MYATYDPTDHTIWGMGETEESSQRDARKWTKSYGLRKTPPLKTIKCSSAISSTIDDSGGYGIDWVIRDGVMELIENPKEELQNAIEEIEALKREIEELKSYRSQFS